MSSESKSETTPKYENLSFIMGFIIGCGFISMFFLLSNNFQEFIITKGTINKELIKYSYDDINIESKIKYKVIYSWNEKSCYTFEEYSNMLTPDFTIVIENITIVAPLNENEICPKFVKIIEISN